MAPADTRPATPDHRADPAASGSLSGVALAAGTLAIYLALALALDPADLIWEESRYLAQAWHLGHGGFAGADAPQILNGPGYPLSLAPGVYAGVPVQGLRAINAAWMALAAWLLQAAIAPYAGRRWAVVVAGVIVMHPVFLRVAPHLMTEAMALACLAGFAWSFTRWWREPQAPRWVAWIATAALAGLMLTRVMFAPVIEVCVVLLALIGCIRPAIRHMAWRSLRVMIPALMLCLPWLFYTAQVSGRTHAWSTLGAEMAYWATSPGSHRGDYVYPEDWQGRPELAAVHGEFLRAVQALDPSDRDAAYRARVIENLRAYPDVAVVNWVNNLSRLAFGYPRPLRTQELSYVPLFLLNVPLALLGAMAFALALRRPRSVPPEIAVLLLIAVAYLGAHSLLPALARYGIMALPLLAPFIAGVLARDLRVTLRD